jgi:hypothetical protein
MARVFAKLRIVTDELLCEPVNEEFELSKAKADKYVWHRFIKLLVQTGFGDYEAAANADLYEAAVFLYLHNDNRERNRKFLLTGKF